VQDGEDDLQRAAALLRVHVDGDAGAVVGDTDPAVVEEGDGDLPAAAGERLVDGVVDDLPHEMVQAARSGRADVHAGAAADGLEPLEDGDGPGVVVAARRLGGRGRGGVGQPEASLGWDVGAAAVRRASGTASLPAAPLRRRVPARLWTARSCSGGWVAESAPVTGAAR